MTAASRLSALLVGLLVVAAPAIGQPVPATDAVAGAPAVPGVCTLEQRAVLREAFEEAARRTREAITFLDSRPGHPHVRLWFGSGKRKVVRQRLSLVAGALRPGQRPAMRCDAASPECRGAFASANHRTRELNFCPSFFRSPAVGQDSRFGVVVHEVSHLVAGTRDAVYGPRRSQALAKGYPGIAVANADNYEYFVELLPR